MEVRMKNELADALECCIGNGNTVRIGRKLAEEIVKELRGKNGKETD